MKIEDQPFVFMITEGRTNDANYTAASERILDRLASKEPFSHVQIREKKLSAGLLFDLTSRAVAICKSRGTKVLVNERFDIAIAAGASGVHLTSTSIPADKVRSVCPENFLVGVSTHSVEEAKDAKKRGADYVFFGPVFETPSKANWGLPKGLLELSGVCNQLPGFPVLALGGVNKKNFESVLMAGAAGYGAIRLFGAVD